MQRKIIFGALALAVVLAGTGPSRADGAFALGLPNDVAKQGVSTGYSYNASSMERAKEVALEYCRKSGSELSKSRCIIVATFEKMCVAVSLDPKEGTPGWGWAIGQTEQSAKEQSLANCQDSAGPARREFCVVSISNCDGVPTKDQAK